MAAPLDEIDRRILRALQQNARTTNSDIARELDMAPSAILERIRKLETRGVITGYEAKLDAKTLGYGLVAFISVRAGDKHHNDSLEARLMKIPEVQEVHCVAGEDCYLLKVRAPDVESLRELLSKIAAENVIGTKTTIVLQSLKESGRVPVRPAETPAASPVRGIIRP